MATFATAAPAIAQSGPATPEATPAASVVQQDDDAVLDWNGRTKPKMPAKTLRK
jgi:hypothetical protein